MNFRRIIFYFLTFTAFFFISCKKQNSIKVLVFSKTEGFRHESIEAGKIALQKLAQDKGFKADFTENSEDFTEKNLKQYNAVIFLNTTGNVFDDRQKESFERYIQAGGGYVGIHAAADTEFDWPWYGELAGAYFLDHPEVQKAEFNVLNHDHISTKGMPSNFEHTDELYNFRNISKNINILIEIDESSYKGGKNPDSHPISWYQEFDGGKAFYTALGHTDESYSEKFFLNHLWGGIRYVTGEDHINRIDFSKSRPEENRFTKVVLAEGLDEPMELTILDRDRILFIQRKGKVMLYNNATQELKEIAKIDVSTKYVNKDGKISEAEDGLLGLNKDPNFEKNNRIYLYYSLPEKSANALVRYELKNDELIEESKKVLLEVPTQREECCHAAGSIAWDAQGNLYLSTGDNTNPHGSNGYSPSDERPGREPWDAQKSSANTNDLRGKILRITPQDDGTYTIPEGNLFPEGTANTRPEIFSMGHRNPFRISIDQHTGYVYWGDVGPDAADPAPDRGPQGHDEIGQARKPGNFGWPHFVGDNKSYNKYDFAKGISGPKWNPDAPINSSPNNTGLEMLPPAQSAFIWYPYANSEEFPLMGSGGRNAMAGPVFYKDDFKLARRAFPEYYDKKLFIYEWMRGFISVVSMNDEGDFVKMERFMPSTTFNNPMDMAFAANGDLYILEYGTGWFQQNDNARLVRIEYNDGNRAPKVEISANKTGGALPLSIDFSGEGTIDLDDDPITYVWTISSGTDFRRKLKGKDVSFTFDKAGIYEVSLAVKDDKDGETTETIEIIAGNEMPKINIELKGQNRSFYQPNKAIKYKVSVTDHEDGILGNGILLEEVSFTADYLPEGFDIVEIARGHKSADDRLSSLSGKRLIASSDCQACHSVSKKSIGPAYMDVAKKYEKDSKAPSYLSDKIIKGGSGVWGETAMAAHPDITKDQALEMANYILSLTQTANYKGLPLEGIYSPKPAKNDNGTGKIYLRATYADKGTQELPSLKSEELLVLRNSTLDPHGFDSEEGVMKLTFNERKLLIAPKSGTYVTLDHIDLNHISAFAMVAVAPKPQLEAVGGKIELRIGSPTGQLIGESKEIKPTAALTDFEMLSIPLKIPDKLLEENQTVYIVFVNNEKPDKAVMAVLGIEVILKK